MLSYHKGLQADCESHVSISSFINEMSHQSAIPFPKYNPYLEV